MSVTIRAIYRDGAFVPITDGEKLKVPENAEVELTVHDRYVLPATAKSDEERERALREFVRKLGRSPSSARRSSFDSL